MGIFSAGWKSRNTQKALEWIGKQKENAPSLSEAARNSRDHDIRKAAVSRITKQPQLVSLARSYCTEAVDVLSDTEALFDIARGPAFFGGEDRNISYYYDICVKDPAFSKVMEPWTVSLEVPKYDEKLREIRLREKRYGFALLAMRKLCHAGSDEQIARLVRESRYDTVRNSAAEEDLKRHPEKAVMYAEDSDLGLEVIELAIEMIDDPDLRKDYCTRLGTHHWECVSTEQQEVGDHLYIDSLWRCRYCGKEEHRDRDRRL